MNRAFAHSTSLAALARQYVQATCEKCDGGKTWRWPFDLLVTDIAAGHVEPDVMPDIADCVVRDC